MKISNGKVGPIGFCDGNHVPGTSGEWANKCVKCGVPC
jgi:hypothetical protein